MDKKIEATIRETLVIGNPVSIKRCVDKLKLIFEQEQALRQANVSHIQESLEQKLKRRIMLSTWNVDGPGAKEEREKQIESLQIVIQMINDE